MPLQAPPEQRSLRVQRTPSSQELLLLVKTQVVPTHASLVQGLLSLQGPGQVGAWEEDMGAAEEEDTRALLDCTAADDDDVTAALLVLPWALLEGGAVLELAAALEPGAVDVAWLLAREVVPPEVTAAEVAGEDVATVELPGVADALEADEARDEAPPDVTAPPELELATAPPLLAVVEPGLHAPSTHASPPRQSWALLQASTQLSPRRTWSCGHGGGHAHMAQHSAASSNARAGEDVPWFTWCTLAG